MTIVDLDLAPRPVSRPRRTAPPRSAVLFVVGLLTLLGVTASARPAAGFAGVLWSAPYDRDADTMTLTPTSLYLFHHDAGLPLLKAYDLATGALRWVVPAPEVVAQVPAVADGVIVAPDGFERYFNRPDLVLARTTRTVARDTHTGAALWHAAGAPADVTDRSVLLVDAGPGDVPLLRAVRLHDGATLWSRPSPGLANVAVLGDAVVTATTDGQVTVLRYGDGTVTRTEKVPWPENGRVSAAAGRLVVASQGPVDRTSVVYRADTLAELWHYDGALTDCGAVLCGADTSGLAGYDPDTGARRWQVPGMTIVSPLSDDRIVVSSELSGAYRLLDPATGRRIGAGGTGLGSWRADGGTAVAGVPVTPAAFVLRAVREAPDETAVVRLDVRTGAEFLLGAVRGSGWTGCRTAGKFLVCLQDTGFTVTAPG